MSVSWSREEFGVNCALLCSVQLCVNCVQRGAGSQLSRNMKSWLPWPPWPAPPAPPQMNFHLFILTKLGSRGSEHLRT